MTRKIEPGAEALKSVDLFSGLSDKELQSLFHASKEVTFDAGHEITTEGKSGIGFHLILEGEAKVTVGGDVKAKLGPGSYFGEISLIDGKPRSASVSAETTLRTMSLTSWNFHPLLEQYPSIANKLLQEMCRRLRAAEASHTH